MWWYPGRLALVAALLLSGVPAKVDADQIDLRGNWQVNINCDLGATASIYFLLDEDVASGSTTVRYTDCGTVEVPGAIRSIASCMFTPSPVVGQVDGTEFELPTFGFLGSEAVITPPFPFLSCSAATEILVAHHLSGTITTDDTGQAMAISGTWVNAEVVFHDTTGATCWSVTNPPPCSFDMRRNDVPAGDQVTVTPRANTTVTFEHVTSPGTVELMPLTEATGAVPEHFQVLSSGGAPIFYAVRTTAQFTGTVTSCFPYPDANGDGLLDQPSVGPDQPAPPEVDETALRVLHEEDGVFVDRTVSLNTTAKVICGVTTSLSQLTVAHALVGPSRDHPFLGGKLVLTRNASGTEIARFSGPRGERFPLPPVGSPDDPREAGAIVEFFSASEQTVPQFAMPAVRWKAGHGGRVFSFHNPHAPNAASPVAFAALNARHHGLKIESRAIGLALTAPQRAVGLRLTVGSVRYCIVFPQATFRRNVANHVIAAGFPPSGSRLALDCADRRMRFALGP